MGCAGKSDSDPNSSPSPETPGPSFEGTWVLTETYQNCEGDMVDASDIWIEIDQKKNGAEFIVGGEELECQIEGQALQCSGEVAYQGDMVQDYSQLTLELTSDGSLKGDASWQIRQDESLYCEGTSSITGIPVDQSLAREDGAIRIENHTSESFELINIVPCEVSYQPWGPNQMLFDNALDPDEDYQINGIPDGCYSLRACTQIPAPDDSGCIVYHQNVYVEAGTLHTIKLESI